MGGSERAWSLMCPFEHVAGVASVSCYVARVIKNKKSPANVSYRAGEGVAVSTRGGWCVRLGTSRVCHTARSSLSLMALGLCRYWHVLRLTRWHSLLCLI